MEFTRDDEKVLRVAFQSFSVCVCKAFSSEKEVELHSGYYIECNKGDDFPKDFGITLSNRERPGFWCYVEGWSRTLSAT